MSASPKSRLRAAALALFAAAALATLLFPESAAGGIRAAAVPAQVPADLIAAPGKTPDGYNPADPRFRSAELCLQLGGKLQTMDGGKVCSEVDESGTFCIVGSADAFPCRGLYKRVIACNGAYNRPAQNPFVCGPRCDAQTQKALGGECKIAVNPDDVIPANRRTVAYVVPEGFTGAAHTIAIQSPGQYTLALPENAQHDGFTLNAIGGDWEIEITRPLESTLNATLTVGIVGKVVCENCYPELITVAATFRVPTCAEKGGEMRGTECKRAIDLDEVVPASLRSVAYDVTMGFTGAAHTVTIGQSPRRHTLALSEGTQYDGFTLNAIGSNWEIEITRRLAGHNATTGITVAGEVSCPECFSESVTVVANLRSICPDSSLPGPAPDWKTNLLDAGEVCALLRRGANVNAQFEHRTPLHHAAGGRLIQRPSIYGEHGFEDEAATEFRLDAFSSEAAKLLIARGASVNAKIPDHFDAFSVGKTPLFLAVEQDFLQVAELLIVNGASINVTTAIELTLLASARSDEMRALLKSYLPPEPEDICRSLGGIVQGIEGGSCSLRLIGEDFDCVFGESSFGYPSCEDVFSKAKECNDAGRKIQNADMCGDACMSSEEAVGTRCISTAPIPTVPAETIASLKADCEALGGTVSSGALGEFCRGYTADNSFSSNCNIDIELGSCTSFFETVKACNADNRPATDANTCGAHCTAGYTAVGGDCVPPF